MIEAKELLGQLSSVADSNKKRVDEYIKLSQEYLRDTPGWSPRHDKIFQEMLNEIGDSRRFKNIAFAGIIFLIISLIGVSVVSFVMNKSKESHVALVESARNAQLALKFRGAHESWLDVTVDPEAVSDPQIRERMTKILGDFPSLGRHYGLGPGKPLKLKRQTDSRWLVLPESGDTTQAMGFVRISEELGKVDYSDRRVELGEEIRYSEVSDFYLKIVGYKNRKEDVKDDVEWQVLFGERREDGPIIWMKQPEAVNQSVNGVYEHEPIVVSDRAWKKIYVVAVGIGKVGTDKKTKTEFAWNLQSYVRSIGLN